MDVQFGKRKMKLGDGENELGQLRDSAALLGDVAALKARMDEDGYLWLRGLLDREKVADTRRFVLDYMAEKEALVPGAPVLEGVMPRDGKTVPMAGRRGVTHDPRVLQTLEAPELFDFFQRYFGEPAVTFDYKWLRAVGNEGFTGAHYDIVYMGRGSDRLHTTWIPLGDTPIDHGTLAVCVGSHRLASFEKLRLTYGRMDVDRDLIQGWFTDDPLDITTRFGGVWRTAAFEMGDVMIFGMHTLHASTTNTTNRYRLSCDVRYQPKADPIDDRWTGVEPRGHYAWQAAGVQAKTMQAARAEWGI